MNEEIESLHRNGTWVLVKPHSDKKIIECKWVFKKRESIPKVEDTRYKTRLVVKDYNHVQDVNFNDIFSSVVKYNSIHVLRALVSMNNLELEQFDVKTSLLHGELEKKIYMKQSQIFEVEGKEDHVCLLKRSLYGLKPSSR